MPKVSIVASYYNRIEQFTRTLDSINRSKHDDVEIIMVDDGSVSWHRLESLADKQDNLKVIRVEPEDKWYVNPCIPFNMGLKEATGDVIIIQNPECLHVGDIISNAASRAEEGKYLSYPCYSLDDMATQLLPDTPHPSTDWHNLLRIPLLPQSMAAIHLSTPGSLGWYNHPHHRPSGYHFCAALTKEDLQKLDGGFDERYANGIGFDDDELVRRIKKNDIEIVIDDPSEGPYVVHQYHYGGESYNSKAVDNMELLRVNQRLFDSEADIEITYVTCVTCGNRMDEQVTHCQHCKTEK